MATITRLESLAGVRIPDTPLAKAAVDLLEAASPQFLCNHCVRTAIWHNLSPSLTRGRYPLMQTSRQLSSTEKEGEIILQTYWQCFSALS
jgi:hypothetical protein